MNVENSDRIMLLEDKPILWDMRVDGRTLLLRLLHRKSKFVWDNDGASVQLILPDKGCYLIVEKGAGVSRAA